MEKKIYPYLIKEQKISKYYEFLLNYKYQVRIFEKKKDEDIYNFFMPQIRDKIFWTFNLRGNKKSFKELSNRIKASVCKSYECNIFTKDETTVVCFDDGICFVISDDKNEVRRIKNIDLKIELSSINLREELSYDIPNIAKIEDKEEYTFLFIIELYKMIFLNKTRKEIQTPKKFNKERAKFVKFIEQIFNTKLTDDEEAIKICGQWEELLDLERSQIKIDNEFDFIYKNNKLNDNIKIQRLCMFLFTVAIIIGIINLWGMME